MKIITRILLLPLLFVSLFCNSRNDAPATSYLNNLGIKLPPGFDIQVYTDKVDGARSMTISPAGVLYVGTQKGSVYAVVDSNKDYKVDKVYTLASGLDKPNGVAFKDGALYVAEAFRIIKYEGIESRLDNPPAPQVVSTNFPNERGHDWKFIAFGPDGKLYVPVGAPCNICLPEDERFESITRMNPDGSGFEVFAHGIRNSVGFDWHPGTHELWFTDNGRDMLGDDIPADELNRAYKPGLHFGFPFIHQGDIKDPEFGEGKNPGDYEKPVQKLGAHVAALGMRFYTGNMFPAEYKNQIFIAQHGSWNRSSKIGYRVMLVKLNGNNAVSYETFAEGWLKGESVSGRPVDVQVMPDGSLLVSDDYNGVIYRIIYKG